MKHGFTTVTRNIEALQKAGIRVSTTMTVIKDNEADAETLQSWAKERNISFSASCRIHLPVRGAESLAREVRTVPDDYRTARSLPEKSYAEEYRDNPFLSADATVPPSGTVSAKPWHSCVRWMF